MRALDGGIDGRNRRAHVEGVLARPLAGALLLRPRRGSRRPAARRCRDRGARGSAVISMRYDFSSPLFHSAKMSCRSRRSTDRAPRLQHVVGLGDQLHVAVLDAVVHHLHVVPRAERAHILDARLAVVGLGGHRQEDRRERVPRLARAAGHDARAPTARLPRRPTRPCPRSETRRPRAALLRRSVSRNQELPPSIRMSPGSRCGLRCAMALSTGWPGRHHHQHPPRLLERRHQRGRRIGAAHLLAAPGPSTNVRVLPASRS